MNTLRLRNNEPSATRLSRCAAFTIIELLVVIALMSIMIALVVPSLGRARSMAESAGCRANLRQMGTAFQRHNSDHRGSLTVLIENLWHHYIRQGPDGWAGIPENSPIGGVQLLSYIVPLVPDHSGYGSNPSGWPHGRGNLVTSATCPTTRRQIRSDCPLSSTYGLNIQAATRAPDVIRLRSINQVKSPSAMLSWSDNYATSPDHHATGTWWFQKRMQREYFVPGFIEANPHYPGLPWVYIHENHVNLAFLDGHVRPRTYEEMVPVLDGYTTGEAGRFWRGQ